jgi:hypothetical protein
MATNSSGIKNEYRDSVGQNVEGHSGNKHSSQGAPSAEPVSSTSNKPSGATNNIPKPKSIGHYILGIFRKL